MKEKDHRSKKQWKTYLKGHWQLYAMLVAPLVVLAVFSYAPMYGIILAFKKYQVSLGIWKSPGRKITD